LRQFFIYQIQNTINGKIYIGSTVGYKRRFRDHKRELNKNIHHNIKLQRAWNKYGGECFSFSIIEENLGTKVFQVERENYYLQKHKPFLDEIGYNILNEAFISASTIYSDEIKKAASERMKGSKNPMFGKYGSLNGKFGKPLSLETRRKQSISRRKKFIGEKAGNVKLTEQQVLEIRAKYIPRVYSSTKLAQEYDVSQGMIMSIVKRRNWTHI